MCDFIREVEDRVLADADDRARERVKVAFLEGMERLLTDVGADLDARIQREVVEGDGDGLLDGLRYARERLTVVASAWTEPLDD